MPRFATLVRVHALVRHLYLRLAHLGPWGLLILGALDSSFLFLPLGNDLLIVGLTTQHPEILPLYAPVATLGSILGCIFLDLVVRKQGEEGLEKIAGKKRMKYLKKKIAERAAFSLALASLAPPPFPFTSSGRSVCVRVSAQEDVHGDRRQPDRAVHPGRTAGGFLRTAHHPDRSVACL